MLNRFRFRFADSLVDEKEDEAAAATGNRIASSKPPANTGQIQRTYGQPSGKRHRLLDENCVATAPVGSSLFLTPNTDLAANIRPTEASQTPSNNMSNNQSVSLSGEHSARASHEHMDGVQDTPIFNSPSLSATENPYVDDRGTGDQNYAQAFFQPFQPVIESSQLGDHILDNQNYAQAFSQPFQPVAQTPQFGDHEPYDLDYAQAFFRPLQPTPGPFQFDDHETEDQNYALAFNQPLHPPTLNLASENPASKDSDLHFTGDSTGRRPDHPCSLGAGDLPLMTKSTDQHSHAQVVDQPFQRAANVRMVSQNIARSSGASPMEDIVASYTAVLAA